MLLTPLRTTRAPLTALPQVRRGVTPASSKPVSRSQDAVSLRPLVRNGLGSIPASVVNRLPQAAPSTVLGTVDYYKWRAADFARRHPGLPLPKYYLGYGDKYAHRFTEELEPKLSPAGQKWLVQARLNLQVAMETERQRDPQAFDRLEQDDKAFTRFAYDTHPKAYVQAGISGLPAKDLMAIGLTPDRKDLLTVMGLAQVALVAEMAAPQIAKKVSRNVAQELEVVGERAIPGIAKALGKAAGAAEGRLIVRTAIRAL